MDMTCGFKKKPSRDYSRLEFDAEKKSAQNLRVKLIKTCMTDTNIYFKAESIPKKIINLASTKIVFFK